MTLLSNVEFDEEANDITGYNSPNGNEYAIIGLLSKIAIVDVTNVENPEIISYIDVNQTKWNDIKVYDHYLYIATDIGLDDDVDLFDSDYMGILIVDISNPSVPTIVNSIDDVLFCHNIHVDSDRLYLVGCDEEVNGIRHDIWIYSLLENPQNPNLIGFWDGGDIHDLDVENNKIYAMNIGSHVGGNEGSVIIIDVSNENELEPAPIIKQWAYENSRPHDCAYYSDQSGEYLLTADEINGGHLKIWDINGDATPVLISEFMISGFTSIHNVYVIDNYAIISYYANGTRILDISNPYSPLEIAFYDTYNNIPARLGVGNWGVFPYLDSGNIISSDIQNGLFVLSLSPDWIVIDENSLITEDENLEDGINIRANIISNTEISSVLIYIGVAYENMNFNEESQLWESNFELSNEAQSGTIEYYITAVSNGGSIYQTDNVFMILGNPSQLIYNDFEEHAMGWFVEEESTNGAWVWDYPHKQTQLIFDNEEYSNAYSYQMINDSLNGFKCFVTGNDSLPTGHDDFLTEETILISPTYNLEKFQHILVEFHQSLLLISNVSHELNYWAIEYSNNDGIDWTLLDETSYSIDDWKYKQYEVSGGGPTKFRFTLNNGSYSLISSEYQYSVANALIDNFSLKALGINYDPEVGDINNDGYINVLDLVIIVEHLIELNVFWLYEQEVADFNQDGIVNILDIMEIVNYLIPSELLFTDETGFVSISKEISQIDNSEYSELIIKIINSAIINAIQLKLKINEDYEVLDITKGNHSSQLTLAHNLTSNYNLNIVLYGLNGNLIDIGHGDIIKVKLKPKGLSRSSGDNTEIVFVEAANSGETLLDVQVVDTETFGRIADGIEKPQSYSLSPVYPNPFNPVTTIPFSLPEESHVNISVYDVQGKLILELYNGLKEEGHHQLQWDGAEYSSGMYIVRMVSNNYNKTQKVLLLK